MSYKNQNIWQLAREISIEIHKMTLEKLPKFELYESGSQIRRSSKSVRANIVEGYGRRQYEADYIKFMVYALSSNDETLDHLETLYETNSLTDKDLYESLRNKIILLGKKLNTFLKILRENNKNT
ncbi:MAG: four helix bundle protein [Saprospiraceae bacterium]|nr:four helix bundle protein [Saprospiraceae bacterium]